MKPDVLIIGTGQAGTPLATRLAASGKHVLIAERGDVSSESGSRHAGFATVEAGDGTEALERLAESPDLWLIVCDMNMPRMDGLEFMGHAKAAGSTVPVVMITMEDEPERVQRAKELGAKGWVVKPFKVETIVAVARNLAGNGEPAPGAAVEGG